MVDLGDTELLAPEERYRGTSKHYVRDRQEVDILHVRLTMEHQVSN